jgi:drug/metabolite transporter (DMT)-like permease
MHNETKGMIYGLLGICAFGLTLPATRVIVPYMDPIFIGMGRAVIAGIVSITLLIYFRQKIPTLKQMRQLVLVSLGVIIGFPILMSWAMVYVPASHGGVILGILPLATTIAGVLIGHEKPSVAFWIVSIVGSSLVILYSLLQGSGSIHIADLALLGAIVSAAMGYAVGTRLSKEMGSWQVICWALALSLPFVVLPALYTAPKSFSNIPTIGFACFLYLSLVSQLLAFFVWYKGLALGGIARVSQVQLLQPFVTLLASALFLGEVIDIETYVFIFLVVCSVWIGKKMPIGKNSNKVLQTSTT